MPAPDGLEETYSREPGQIRRRYRGRMEICRVCHGVLGTASPPFLEQNHGGARSHPSIAVGTQDSRRGGVSTPGPQLSQDLHMTPIPHRNDNNSPNIDEIP